MCATTGGGVAPAPASAQKLQGSRASVCAGTPASAGVTADGNHCMPCGVQIAAQSALPLLLPLPLKASARDRVGIKAKASIATSAIQVPRRRWR